ncbi:MAG: Gmad2 immunoglobulin-like domain-containing protein [Egibacteraceae bacterium]
MARLLGLALAVLVLLVGCAAPPQDPAPSPSAPPRAEPGEPVPSASPSPAATPDAPDGARQVTTFFLRDQSGRLWIEPVVVPLDRPTRAVAQAAVSALLRGQPGVPGLFSPADPATRVLGASVERGTLDLDLSGEVRAQRGGAAAEAAFAQQLAHAVAQFDGIDAVRLRVDGAPVDELWGHLDWSEPISPDPFALAPVVIADPPWGASVSAGALTVRGEANTFEATVLLRLIAPDGRVAEETFTTASCGTGCRGTWSHTFPLPTPGRWTVEASEDDPSDGEGRPPFTARLEVEAR